MSAALPIKKEKRSRPSTEVNNSFVKNVTSRVSGLLPSTITKWFSSPSSSNTNGSATVAESSDSSTEDEASGSCTQPPAKRMRYAFECECKSPSTSNNYITPEMKCTSTNTESIETFSSVQSPIGQSTSKTETHIISTSLLSPKEETTISEHEINVPVYNLHTPFSSHSFVEKRKSLFGGPADVTEKLPPSNSFRDSQPHFKPGLFGSPFYSGKTRYGGAASSYTNQPNIKHRKDMLVSNSANNDSTMVSHVTRRVMDLLENYSSPLIEAKRISQFSRSHTNSLDNTIENNAYKKKELYVPKIASILHFKQKAKLMGTTSAARQIIASNSSSPAFKPYPSSKSHSNSLDPTSEKLTTRLTRFNRDEQKLTDSNTTVQLPTAILQNEEFDLPKFTLEMTVAKISTTSETSFTSTTITEAGKSNKATNVTTSAGDKIETTPTIVIMKDDNESMNINEVAGKPQNDYLYKFSRPDMVLDESIQNSLLIPNYIFGSPERQAIVQSTEKQNKKEKCIDKEKKEEKEEKESGKLISIASENNIDKQSGKWKCENCWVFNNLNTERCICCDSKVLGKSNIDNTKCTECKIASRQEHNDKCIECEKKINKSDKLASKLTVPISSKWKCEDCWVENDQDVTKCVCCGGNNNLLSSGLNFQSDEWKCEECWIKNKNNFVNCVACGGPKPATKEITSKDVVPPSSTANTITNNDTLFKKIIKSQSDQWECPNCLVRNDNNRSKCNCCDTERPGTYKEADKKSFNFGSVQNTTFKFGITPSENIPLKKPELSSVTQFKMSITESETNNNIVPEPLKFNFGIPQPTSINNIITEEESIAEDRTPPPEETFKFGLSTVSTIANVFSNSAIPASKCTENMLISNSKESDEKVQEVPDIEEPNSFVSVNTLKSGQLFGFPLNNSSAESSMQTLITFRTAGQSSNDQAKQAIATTVEDTKVPQSTFSFTASSIKPGVNLFSSTVTTTSTSSISFPTAPTPTIAFFQKNEVAPNQTFFPQNTMTPSTLSLFNKNEAMTTTVAASSNVQIFSFGGNNQNIQTEKPKFKFTFGNKSEVPSLFTSPMSNTNNTVPGNVMAENTTVSGTVMSGGNGLPTGNPSLGGNGLPLNSLSSGLLAGPAKKDGMWPLNSDLNSFKMTSGTNIETSVNNLSSIQPGSLFVTQPKKENVWPSNQNASNDSMGTLKHSSGNNLEPITDPLGLPTGRFFGAPEKKDTMWSPNNNNSNNMFGTNPSTNNLQKSTPFTFGSSNMQFNGNSVTPPTFGSSIQPAQNIFGIANQNNNNPTLFSHPIQHQTPPNIFGAQQINNSTPVGMFGPPNVAGSPRFGTSNPPISTFEAPQLNSVPTPTFNFGAQQTTGVFGFGQQQPPAQGGVYNFGAQPVGQPQRQFNIGTASAPNMVGRRVIRKAVRRTTQR